MRPWSAHVAVQVGVGAADVFQGVGHSGVVPVAFVIADLSPD
jgi:hypothetical protein